MDQPYVLHDIMEQFATQGCESIDTNAEEQPGKEEKKEYTLFNTVEVIDVQPSTEIQSIPAHQLPILTNLRKFLSERYSFAPDDPTKTQ